MVDGKFSIDFSGNIPVANIDVFATDKDLEDLPGSPQFMDGNKVAFSYKLPVIGKRVGVNIELNPAQNG